MNGDPPPIELFFNTLGLHNDPVAWEHRMEFMQERLMNNSTLDVNGPDFRTIPFGYGRSASKACWYPCIFFNLLCLDFLLLLK